MTFVPVGSQQDVITSEAPVQVVLAGAGTGKTTTAAAAAAAHLRRSDDAREQQRRALITGCSSTPLLARARVLFLSFSRTAVSQVIDRASDVVGPLLDRIDVATFDGLAWRIINDFGLYYGFPPPLNILSAADAKVPGATAGMTYAQLIPAATKILKQATVASHYERRYSLVICDEFQDTSDREWAFVQLIAPAARRILLGDLNQCIYADMKKIDPQARIAQALSLPGAERVDLPVASHRDPTEVLPAAAAAARERRFDDKAITVGVATGRLMVTSTTADRSHSDVAQRARDARAAGRTVSIFTHTIAATAALSDALTAAGLRHEQVGFSEAYGEALNAQLSLLTYALTRAPGGRRALAVYVAANSRGSSAPPLVYQIINKSNTAFERALEPILGELIAAAGPPVDVDRLGDAITAAYSRIGLHRGQETWVQAARRTRAAIRQLGDGAPLAVIEEQLQLARHSALVGNTGQRSHPVQVMNLHQTKGREADTTLLLLQPDEFHGHEIEPYPLASRLLYVVLTRARHEAHIIVPPEVHPLWRPLIAVCHSVARARSSSSI